MSIRKQGYIWMASCELHLLYKIQTDNNNNISIFDGFLTTFNFMLSLKLNDSIIMTRHVLIHNFLGRLFSSFFFFVCSVWCVTNYAKIIPRGSCSAIGWYRDGRPINVEGGPLLRSLALQCSNIQLKQFDLY